MLLYRIEQTTKYFKNDFDGDYMTVLTKLFGK